MIRRGAHGCSQCTHDHDCAAESRIVLAEASYERSQSATAGSESLRHDRRP